MSIRSAFAIAMVAAAATHAEATVVFENFNDNGYFTPFTPSSSPSIKYGDSGWFGLGSDPAVQLQSITLGLAVSSTAPVSAGTTDIVFSFNDGDPSGLVFGSGAPLYSTTLTGVSLPALAGAGSGFLSVTIPLPGVSTLGGFNNVGWSIQVRNYAYAGNFGFQVSSANGQAVGFYTNNASFFDGTNWSLFSFGPDPVFGIANYVARIEVPAPGSLGLLAVSGLWAGRRRRR